MTLQVVLAFLHLLHKLNNLGDEGNIVPYSTFHLPELIDHIDIRQDYVKWISEKDSSVSYSHDVHLNYSITDDSNLIYRLIFSGSEGILPLSFSP